MGVYQSQYMQNATTSHPKIIGIGKNYLKMSQGLEIPQLPTLFYKPWATVTFNPSKVYLPAAKIHKIVHEVELGVFICKGGKKIPKQNALDHVGGYFLAIDFSDLDWLKIEKQKGITNPFIKAQDDFCPISELIGKNVNPYQIELQLKVNGKIRQKDKAKNMFFKIDDIISLISQQIRLEPGDLILTGSPQGAQPVRSGDQVEVYGRVGQTLLTKMEFQVSVQQKP